MIKLTDICDLFKDDISVLRKGEKKFDGNHVLHVKLQGNVIKSLVQASMKDTSYNVSIDIDSSAGKIISSSCECPRGQWLCSHIAATLIAAEKRKFSVTDLPQKWMRHPKKERPTAACSSKFSELFPEQSSYRALNRPVNDDDIRSLYSILETKENYCGMWWYLSPEPTSSNDSEVIFIEDVLSLYVTDPDLMFEKLKVNREQIERIAAKEAQTALWSKLRRFRLTASNFGKVIKATNRNSFPPSLFKTLKNEYDLSSKDCIIWGQTHESTALQQFNERHPELSVTPTGLWLYECGYLAATPDGLAESVIDLDENYVIEVKCPYLHRNRTIQEAIDFEKQRKTLKTFCLTENLTINTDHDYYHQIQGQLHAVDRDWAIFLLWTSKELFELKVPKDIAWRNCNISKLKSFYMNQLLPNLLQ